MMYYSHLDILFVLVFVLCCSGYRTATHGEHVCSLFGKNQLNNTLVDTNFMSSSSNTTFDKKKAFVYQNNKVNEKIRDPEACQINNNCYPQFILVRGLNLQHNVGTNSFILHSLFPSDIFAVTLKGPEITFGVIYNFRNGSYQVRYCVGTKGNYKLHIKIQLLDDCKLGFNRELHGSP